MRKKEKFIDNKTFVREKFEWLVDNFGGQTVVISNGEIFTEDNAVEKAKKKYSKIMPLILSVPRLEFFTHHFLL